MNELYHHGIKGMHWGVRRYQNPDGTLTRAGKNRYLDANGELTEAGKSKYGTKENYQHDIKYDRILKTVAITAGVAAAVAVGGTIAYKYRTEGKLAADLILKKGEKIQNIAPTNRQFDTSFYAVKAGTKDAQFFIKNFSQSGRTKATILEAGKDIKIAGRKEILKSVKDVTGIADDQAAERWVRKFGALTEAERQPLIKSLEAKGYQGFKDINDIRIGWGKTPMVLFGDSRSNVNVVKSAQINLLKTYKMDMSVSDLVDKTDARLNALRGYGAIAAYSSMYGIAGAGTAKGISVHVNKMNRMANEAYGSNYRNLTSQQKRRINSDYRTLNRKANARYRLDYDQLNGNQRHNIDTNSKAYKTGGRVYYTKEEAVRAYKEKHPNTRKTNSQILRSLKY